MDYRPRTIAEALPGMVLGALIAGVWLALHVNAIFFIDWSQPGLWLFAIPVIALQTWLSVGLFIVAHDCMHGSFAPGHKPVNDIVGRALVFVYAGFSYRKLYENHHDHHRYAGTDRDPDFDPDHPSAFWPWYYRFFRTYFGWREFGMLTVIVVIYLVILGWRFPNVLLFWALPAILSSLQLFYFGTYRPHHIGDPEFPDDRHRARSNDFPWLVSLLTCFHFGYHHEHHDKPGVPWWRLPAYRAAVMRGEG
jgi:beta-carotene ketolase (CrtW type)